MFGEHVWREIAPFESKLFFTSDSDLFLSQILISILIPISCQRSEADEGTRADASSGRLKIQVGAEAGASAR